MLTDPTALLILLTLVAVAAYIQTVAGFAYGLVVMGVVGWLELAPLPTAAILVSLTSLVNVLVALRGARSEIDGRLALPIIAGLLPALVAGVFLLDHLSQQEEALLHSLLGMTLLAGGSLLMLKPSPYSRPSHPWSLLLFGILGGLGGGMFSVSGPPVVFHLYRQPRPLQVLKTTLLAIFGAATLARIITVSLNGQMTLEVLTLGLIATPVVSLATLAGRHFPPPLSELTLKRLAFLLVALMGIVLLR